jgi:hypothetical protein
MLETVARMSPQEPESGEEAIDESGRNLTQQRTDQESPEQKPLDVEWEDEQ